MFRTNKMKRVRMLRDATLPRGRMLKGLVLKVPEREAAAMIAAGMAAEVPDQPKATAPPPPVEPKPRKSKASTVEESE